MRCIGLIMATLWLVFMGWVVWLVAPQVWAASSALLGIPGPAPTWSVLAVVVGLWAGSGLLGVGALWWKGYWTGVLLTASLVLLCGWLLVPVIVLPGPLWFALAVLVPHRAAARGRPADRR